MSRHFYCVFYKLCMPPPCHCSGGGRMMLWTAGCSSFCKTLWMFLICNNTDYLLSKLMYLILVSQCFYLVGLASLPVVCCLVWSHGLTCCLSDQSCCLCTNLHVTSKWLGFPYSTNVFPYQGTVLVCALLHRICNYLLLYVSCGPYHYVWECYASKSQTLLASFTLFSAIFCVLCTSDLWVHDHTVLLMTSSMSPHVATSLKISLFMPSSSSPFMNYSVSDLSYFLHSHSSTFCHSLHIHS